MEPLFRNMVESASRAPSVHNSQPWRFSVSAGVLRAGLERSRLLPALDPLDRLAWVALGAAVESARLTALRAGQDVEVHWFESELEDEHDGWPVAVQPVPQRGISRQDIWLADQIEHQAVMRGRMAELPAPTSSQVEEAAVAALPGARLLELPPGRSVHLVDLVERTTQAELSDRALRRERLAWTRTRPVGTPRVGVKASELATSRLKRIVAPLALSRPLVVPLGMPRRLARAARLTVASTPAFLAVTGTSADRAGWFDTGRGWQRASLALAAHEFATHWLASPVMLAEAQVKALFEISAAEPIALVARVGRPLRPPREPSHLDVMSLLR